MTATGLTPGRALSVGITGHRPERLQAEQLEGLAHAVAEVLAVIDGAAQTAPTAIRLVSALAEGADSMAADAALARGWPLDVVLPFHRGDYVADFADGSVRDAHAERLARARTIFELAGDRAAIDGDQIAYERAGRLVLAQCDLLVAVWDNGPVRGRGGAAQIVAEAVLQGIPVLQIDPAQPDAPQLLWDGLEELDLGQQTVETVARAGIEALPALLETLLAPPDRPGDADALARFGQPLRRSSASFAYPLLLAVMGARSRRARPLPEPVMPTEGYPARIATVLTPRFAQADAAATRFAQIFRSGYVANFTLAAVAVILSLMGLALPSAIKPVLIVLELCAIGIILALTRIGNRTGWHRRWLDSRALAEHLRCLSVSAQIGDLNLREAERGTPAWVAWHARGTARELGLPNAVVDEGYLANMRQAALALIDEQIAYLSADAHRMHTLEHRLHRLGTLLFMATAATCLALLLFKTMHTMIPGGEALQSPFAIAATIIGAALPAVGAAIYGIRMQGEFAGIATRNEALVTQLATLRKVMSEDALTFDMLHRRIRRMTALLTGNLESWLQTYDARPLALPG